MAEQLDAALEVPADGFGKPIACQPGLVDGALELLAAGDADDEVVEPVGELQELGVRGIVLGEARFEVGLEPLEEGGAEDVLDVGVEERVQLN